jgi:hypothetical protein
MALAQHGTNQHSEGPDNISSSSFGTSAAYLIGGGHTRPDNVRSGRYGTSAAYLIAKLKRDAPEDLNGAL